MVGGDDRGAEAEDRMLHQKKVEHFTEQGRRAEISVDLEQAKALLSDNNVSGPEDSVVSEMIKQLPLEIFTCLRGGSWNVSWGASRPRALGGLSGWCLLRKPDVELRKRFKSNKAMALTSVMSKWVCHLYYPTSGEG